VSFYTNLQTTATRLLTKYGQSYTFTTYTQGAYDPGTGTNSVTTSTYSKKGVKTNFSKFERTNTAIQKGDMRFIVETGTYAVGDTVSINSEEWRIMDAEPIEPGATNVIYILQLRK